MNLNTLRRILHMDTPAAHLTRTSRTSQKQYMLNPHRPEANDLPLATPWEAKFPSPASGQSAAPCRKKRRVDQCVFHLCLPVADAYHDTLSPSIPRASQASSSSASSSSPTSELSHGSSSTTASSSIASSSRLLSSLSLSASGSSHSASKSASYSRSSLSVSPSPSSSHRSSAASSASRTSASRSSIPASSSPLSSNTLTTTPNYSESLPTTTPILTSSGSTSSTLSTGVLGTNAPSSNPFSRNVGGIVGVAIGGVGALILGVVSVFLLFRRSKRRRGAHDDAAAWRTHVDGDSDHGSFRAGRRDTQAYTNESATRVGGSSSEHHSMQTTYPPPMPPSADPPQRRPEMPPTPPSSSSLQGAVGRLRGGYTSESSTLALAAADPLPPMPINPTPTPPRSLLNPPSPRPPSAPASALPPAPPPPSPDEDEPRTPHGLLHPSLGVLHHPSERTLGDHVDYSRPIGARMESGYTFESASSVVEQEEEDGGVYGHAL
ncbi:hypothetical protein B0H10DRAFT_2059525 [Mycena sp. CBHHK59/15]|nr:hypothetical protein B0H10DRAFT_2059525 [Mycena sp. CBHHK59/15]